MTTSKQRPDHGRAARAADLVATLAELLPLGHPGRPVVRELQNLFALDNANIRELLERVPGRSLAQKGERIGISKQALWSIWHGRYRPNREVMARIKAAAGVDAEEKLDAD